MITQNIDSLHQGGGAPCEKAEPLKYTMPILKASFESVMWLQGE